jgi:hypothetical protein
MELLKSIENFLNDNWGKYYRSLIRTDYRTSTLSFSKPLWGKTTVLMVVKTPVGYDNQFRSYFIQKDEPIKFFLYDRETDMVFGCISEIWETDNWQEFLNYKILTAEDRLNRSICPECGFWLVERTNQHGHAFMGCCGFPACNYSSEISLIYDDED